jgi:hypothetical protein
MNYAKLKYCRRRTNYIAQVLDLSTTYRPHVLCLSKVQTSAAKLSLKTNPYHSDKDNRSYRVLLLFLAYFP